MKRASSLYNLHYFVCTNSKDKGESCGAKGSSAIKDELKAWIRDRGWHKQVRINNAGCLGHCEYGIVIVGYPNADWSLKVTKKNLQDIKDQIKERIEPFLKESGSEKK